MLTKRRAKNLHGLAFISKEFSEAVFDLFLESNLDAIKTSVIFLQQTLSKWWRQSFYKNPNEVELISVCKICKILKFSGLLTEFSFQEFIIFLFKSNKATYNCFFLVKWFQYTRWKYSGQRWIKRIIFSIQYVDKEI